MIASCHPIAFRLRRIRVWGFNPMPDCPQNTAESPSRPLCWVSRISTLPNYCSGYPFLPRKAAARANARAALPTGGDDRNGKIARGYFVRGPKVGLILNNPLCKRNMLCGEVFSAGKRDCVASLLRRDTHVHVLCIWHPSAA